MKETVIKVNDIIAAIATPFGTSALAIIRISGKGAIALVNTIFKGANLEKKASHTISYGHIIKNEKLIDEVMVSIYKAPKTYTKEEMVEITTHGGILVVQNVLNAVLSLEGVRLARPGEFSERAYLNGRIDLIEAESIMDIIHAENENALKIAHLGITRETTKLIDDLRSDLLDLIARIEVNIDYPEYDDAVVMSKEIIKPKTLQIIDKMHHLLTHSKKTQMVREGVNTLILGRPNVGKSSLLNALLNEEKAIVTNIAGTTRDMVEATINIGPVNLHLIDSAGIRKTDDVVEKIGVDKALNALDKAKLVLLVLDQSSPMTTEDLELIDKTKNKPRIIIANKTDLENHLDYLVDIGISTYKQDDIEALKQLMIQKLELENIESDYNFLSNVRHIDLLNQAKKQLEDVITSIEHDMPIDIYAIELTESWSLLGNIMGSSYQDELLDELFSKFCLGK